MNTRLQELRNDYRLTLEGYMEAKKNNDKPLIRRLSEDLVRIADQMEIE